MRRISHLLFATGLGSLLALLPVAAQASTSLTENVVGSEYAVGSCNGGSTGSFAGYGSAPATPGKANAIFNTTICHTALSDTPGATANILSGGNFALYMDTVTLVGEYITGTVGPGKIWPLYPGSNFCKEVYPVTAFLGPLAGVPMGAPNIISGTVTDGTLTYFGKSTYSGTTISRCTPFAARIAGQVKLTY